MTTTVRFMQSPEVLARVERQLTNSGTYDEHFRRRSGATWRHSAERAVIAFLAVLGVLELYDALSGDDASGVLIAAIVGAIALLWTRATELRLADRRAGYLASLRTHERSAAWLVNEGPTEVSLCSEAISYRGPRLEVSFRWETVSEVRRTGRDVVIWTLTGWSLVVAGEAFGSDDEAEGFARDVERRSAAAAGRSIIVTFLADHDLSCARCRYPLRGVREPICPECGRPVGFEDLRRASDCQPAELRSGDSVEFQTAPEAPGAAP